MRLTDNDRLRIAEYYYLLQGKQVGPLRQMISERLSSTACPLDYGGYVDLVNLGAQRIYTTNFDNLIERTYRELGVRHEVIIDAANVASSSGLLPQVVKYHGDLRNDHSLVLTESSYFQRLDFESPLDLKFRADILGRAVLFIGYSFRDINIRAIWARLMDMMRGVPHDQIPVSYMVTIKSNPVEEALYRDAGIQMIVLDPQSVAAPEDYGTLLSDFLYELATSASPNAVPISGRKPFASKTLLRRIMQTGSDHLMPAGPRYGARWSQPDPSGRRQVNGDIARLGCSELPSAYRSDFEHALDKQDSSNVDTLRTALRWLREFPLAPGPVRIILSALRGQFLRDQVIEQPIDDRINFDGTTPVDVGIQLWRDLLSSFGTELSFHRGHSFDDDLFYVAKMSQMGVAGAWGLPVEMRPRFATLLADIDELYPGVLADLQKTNFYQLHAVAVDHQPENQDEYEDEDEDGEDPDYDESDDGDYDSDTDD